MENIDLKKLQEPIKNISWKVQSFKDTKNGIKAICVAYIDARDVQNRFDEVCGIENWQDRYKEVKGNLFCEIGVRINGEWVWKSDVGTESNFEKQKGEASDALKRTAVMWGVGRHLYSLPPQVINAIQIGQKKYPSMYNASDKNYTPIYDNMVLSDYINNTVIPAKSKNHGK